MAGYYELKLAKDGQFHFQLLAGNGQIILGSEMYKSREAAMNGISSVQANCAEDDQFERKQSENGKPYFVLKAKNHQVIGQSQMYSSEESRDNGIESVKSNGPCSEIRDLTSG
jgi:uncharacterized protein YegP (UPF0339 family)